MTAVSIVQLCEAGVLSLDDPVSKFINYPDKQHAKCILLKHLLSHTSGLGSYFNEKFYSTPRHKIRTVDDYLNLTAGEVPKFEAGSSWDYSNTGMVLLGKIIEIVTGLTYFDYVRRNIFEPCGMCSSDFLFLDEANKNVAVGYTQNWSSEGHFFENNLYQNFVGGCPAGGNYSTALDIWKFTENLKAETIISSESLELLSTAKPELNSPYYGYRFNIHPERRLIGHSGGMLGCSANFDIVLQPEGWTIIVLANDLGMRSIVLKARQLIGLDVPEAVEARSYLPRAGLALR